MEPARLPDELLQQEPQHLKDLEPCEQMFVVFTEFVVDERRRCYLNANAEERRNGVSRIAVRRDLEGNYHVDMPEDNRYKPGKLFKDSDRHYVPVASINIISAGPK